MTTISAKAILVSRNSADPDPNRKLATILCKYPRWIHAEGRTHRQLCLGEDEFDGWEPRTPALMEDPNLSRNASSSRAIPVSKLIDAVMSDPAIPLFWGRNQKGMQAGPENDALVKVWQSGPFEDAASEIVAREVDLPNEQAWLQAMYAAVHYARRFDRAGYHKQIVNRLLEPFSHITVVVTATEWSNFFDLRIHKDAEPHIKLLAERIREAIDTAPVQTLGPGGWHLPFVNDEDHRVVVADMQARHLGERILDVIEKNLPEDDLNLMLRKLSVARCASTSYKTVEGFDMTLERATALYDKLVSSVPMHASPLEHVAQADDCVPQYEQISKVHSMVWLRSEQHRNFVGFRQYRAMIAGECQ